MHLGKVAIQKSSRIQRFFRNTAPDLVLLHCNSDSKKASKQLVVEIRPLRGAGAPKGRNVRSLGPAVVRFSQKLQVCHMMPHGDFVTPQQQSAGSKFQFPRTKLKRASVASDQRWKP